MKQNIKLVVCERDLCYYPECEKCEAVVCEADCFRVHVGSLIALEKVLKRYGIVHTKILV
jgi:hypothetical protein